MASGITVRVLGDTGPFSRQGLSISYLLEIGEARVLIDCGAPLFQLIPHQELKSIDRLIITHCHDDHKRWFTDLALFHHYAPDVDTPLRLMATDEVLGELRGSTRASLGLSLSEDSRQVVGLTLDDYVDSVPFGPRARYRIAQLPEGPGRTQMRVVDLHGVPVGPERAKVVVDPRCESVRMLFRDPVEGCWVEPASFYAFSDERFYEASPRACRLPDGTTIEPINAPVWHGLPTVGLRVRSGETTLVFSSDTRHDVALWDSLWREKRVPVMAISGASFEDATVLEGDINDYLERSWSERRYLDAMVAFSDALVIHDVAGSNSVVHTDGSQLVHTELDPERTLLTHAPDHFTSAWPLTQASHCYHFEGDRMGERVAGEIRPLTADYYHKQDGRLFVLFKDDGGSHQLCEHQGFLRFDIGNGEVEGEPVCRVDVYEDVGGRYLPLLEPAEGHYRLRDDGLIERVGEHAGGSEGTVVADQRFRLEADI